MDSMRFKISRLLLYFILVSVFLFISGNVGQYLIEAQDMNRKVAMLPQGGIFTGLTLIVLYILKRKSPGFHPCSNFFEIGTLSEKVKEGDK